MRFEVVLVALLVVMAEVYSRPLINRFAKENTLNPRVPKYKTFWFNQRLDHFNFNEDRKWSQRYLVCDVFSKPGSPILFYTGNEGDILMFYNNTGLMFELARKWSSLIIFAEHRYYGESLPFGSESFERDNIHYLTSEQALADYARLLTLFKKSNPNYSKSPVVSFGGSYGGMLTAWFRQSYPNVVIGGLASSAPVAQFEGLSDPYSFSRVVTDDFSEVDEKCPETIRRGFLELRSGLNLKSISSEMKLCRPIETKSDVLEVVGWMENAFTYMAMTDYPSASNFLQPLPAWPVRVACQKLLSGGTLFESIARAVGVYYNTSGSQKCFDFSKPESSGVDDVPWNYQACSELVLPSGSNGVTDMFLPQKWDLKAYVHYCNSTQHTVPRPYWIPLKFGGYDLSSYSNIIFSNGELDPWHTGGILHSQNPRIHTFLIRNAAHHLDLRFTTKHDPPSVLEVRRNEAQIIQSWITQYFKQVTPQNGYEWQY